jgi:hypothetical protein
MHVGLDEVFVIGECERCKDTPNADLFAKAVNDYHAHLVGKRGVEMQMWGDRLLDAEATGYGLWEASANGTAPAIDMIPKDIVMCDWHYEVVSDYHNPPEDYPSVRYFQEQGFRVWPGGWNKPAAVRRLIEVSRENAGENMLGYLATTWTSVDEVAILLVAEQLREKEERTVPVADSVRLAAQLLKK